jgi:hypothetical protein
VEGQSLYIVLRIIISGWARESRNRDVSFHEHMVAGGFPVARIISKGLCILITILPRMTMNFSRATILRMIKSGSIAAPLMLCMRGMGYQSLPHISKTSSFAEQSGWQCA